MVETKKVQRIKGFTFWSTNKINKVFQESPSTMAGTHWWKGAAPILINRAEIIKKELKILCSGINILVVMIITEAIAWVKKYFKLDSDLSLFFFTNIKGINESKLISMASQTINHLVAESTAKTDTIRELKNRKEEGCKNIN